MLSSLRCCFDLEASCDELKNHIFSVLSKLHMCVCCLLLVAVKGHVDWISCQFCSCDVVDLVVGRASRLSCKNILWSTIYENGLHCVCVPVSVEFETLLWCCDADACISCRHAVLNSCSSRSSGLQLHSTESYSLLVPLTCHTTIGDRAFPVAAARAWNSLPQRVRAASSIVSFRQELKTYLF